MGECSCPGRREQSCVLSLCVFFLCLSIFLTMAVGQAWRRPRMKVYDYNQEFGGNYYQPMIQYINHKNIYGPFSRTADVYLPHAAEVTSAKYTNMRYNDKSSLKHNLDQFLVDAHKTQIKELNGTTASVMNTRMRRQMHNTTLTPTRSSKLIRDHYVKLVKNLVLLGIMNLPPLA